MKNITEQQKIILQAFEYSFQNYNDEEKLKEISEALTKAENRDYLPHTIKSILTELGFYKNSKITQSGKKYLSQNRLT